MHSTIDGTIGETASLNPSDYVHISFISDISLDAAQSLTRSLSDFLSLLVGDWISPSRMRLRINGVWVDFWCHSVTPEHALSRWIQPNRVLQHSAIDFQSVLDQWTMLRSRIEVAFNVMRAAWSNNITLIDAKLLLSAQAIEGLHRRLYNGKYIDDVKFIELCDIVKTDLKKLVKEHNIEYQLAQKLNTVFDYANEYSLRQRIKELRNDLLHIPKSSILISNIKVEDIVSMRNALAHNIEHNFPSIDMYKNYVRIRWLFEASILNRLNIDGNVIQEILDARYERML